MTAIAAKTSDSAGANVFRDRSEDRTDIPFVVVAIAIFIAMRVLVVAGRSPGVTNDTSSYLTVKWWQGERLPTVPLFYWLVGRNATTIVALQTGISATIWAFVGIGLARQKVDCGVRRGFLIAFLLLGVSRPIAGHDVMLMSESISISLSVLLIAITYQLVLRSRPWLLLSGAVVFVAWLFARQSHAYTGFLLVIPVALLAIRRRSERRTWILICLFIVTFSSLGAVAGSSRGIQESSLSRLVCVRILHDSSRFSWFRSHGMPDPPAVAAQFEQLPCVRVLGADSSMHRWMIGPGYSTYAKFVLSHPGYLRQAFGRDSSVALFTGPEVPQARQVLPTFLVQAIWPRGSLRTGVFVSTLGLVTLSTLARAWRRRRWPTPLLFFLGLMALVVPGVMIVWVGLPAPIQRQTIIVAIELRIAVLCLMTRDNFL